MHTGPLLNALLHHGAGRLDDAAAAADSARAVLEEMARDRPDDARVLAALGTAYALLGRRDDAVGAGREAVRLIPTERDAMDGPEYLLQLARIHVLTGDEEAAMDVIDELLGAPTRHTLRSVLREPAFAALRDHPRVTGR